MEKPLTACTDFLGVSDVGIWVLRLRETARPTLVARVVGVVVSLPA